jgi:hypothetical protein
VTDAADVEPPVLGRTFQHFVEFLRESDASAPLLSPMRFSQAMHIDLQTLAEQAHVHRNTISRAPGSRGVQEFLREALRAIKAATDLKGDLNKALFWYWRANQARPSPRLDLSCRAPIPRATPHHTRSSATHPRALSRLIKQPVSRP